MYGMTNNSLPGNVIATPGSHQPSFGWGSWDAFLVRFDGNGVRQWGTFYGGSGTEWTGEIAVNGSDVYIAGSTSSSSSIATPSTHQPTLAGQDDAFLVKFDANGNRIWGTYYGGTQFEDPGGTAVDSQGNVYLTGASRSGGGTVIATPCTYQFIYAGAGDGFLAKFTPSCKRIWGTYYGGSGYDWAGSIDIDGMDNILIGGQTSTMSGPAIASSNGHQPGYGGGNDDAFLAKFSPCTTAVMPNTTPPPNMVICAGGTTQLTTTMSVCGLNWFDAPIDGNTIGTTTILTTPNLTVNTTFYIGDISCGTPDTLTPVEVTVHPLPNMSTIASSTVLCSGQLSTLTAQGAMTYTWLPVQVIGSVLTVTASSTTIYSVTGFDGNCFNSTTVTVESVPVATLNINSQANPACYGSTVALTASGAQTYSWYPPALFSAATGSLVYTAPIQSAVNYTIVGYNVSGAVTCSTQNTYSLSVLPQTIASISPSVEVCEGSKINLVAGGGNVYLWAGQNLENNNGPSIFASPSISSVYTTSVSNNNICPVTATVFVKVNPKPDVFAGNDTLIDLGDPVFISATGSGTLKWISGENIGCVDCPSTHVLPYTKSCYVVETTNDKGCKAQDDVCIEIRNDYGVYIPNTFTPNGDGINDIFYVYGFGIREYKMTIYDRWGIKLFVSTDQTQGWNGIYNGEICQQGTYIYYVEYIPYKGKHEIRPGHVNIIRGKP
jgi:gliding motility-associated-like protein